MRRTIPVCLGISSGAVLILTGGCQADRTASRIIPVATRSSKITRPECGGRPGPYGVIDHARTYIVGDLQPGNGTAYARTNMKKRFSAQTPLISSGLLGPVKISYALNVRSVLK